MTGMMGTNFLLKLPLLYRCNSSLVQARVRITKPMPETLGPIVVKDRRKPVFPIRTALTKINSQYPDVYAKLLIHNFPFTVVRTDLIIAHRMKDVQVGDIIELDEVREVGSVDYKLRGLPLLPKGAVKVRATVLEHTYGEKKRAKVRKQRKGRRPLRTIKPRITTLRIQDIIINPSVNL